MRVKGFALLIGLFLTGMGFAGSYSLPEMPEASTVPTGNWYISGFGGAAFVPDNRITAAAATSDSSNSLRIKMSTGFHYGAALGYRVGGWHAEIQYTHNLLGIRHIDPYEIAGGGAFVGGDLPGKVNVYSGLINVFREFYEVSDIITPYVGLGLGFARLQLNASVPTGSDPATRFLKQHDHRFAYQASAGVSYHFDDRFSGGIYYRFLGTLHPSFFTDVGANHFIGGGLTYNVPV